MRIDLSNPDLYSKLYLPIITNRDRYLLMYGGRDSAKSHTASQKIIFNILNEKYCKVVCLRKIFADIKDSQFSKLASIIKAWGLEDLFHQTKSPLEITCKLNGNQILARGLDRPSKTKSVDDPTIVWFEEADEIGYKDYISTNTSIRGSNTLLQLILTFNPESEDGWINKEFFPPKSTYENKTDRFHYVESIKPKTTILHSTYLDNEFCTEDRAEVYQGLKNTLNNDDNFYKVYCLGLWGAALRGLIYNNWKLVDKMPDMAERKYSGYALDFGFTNDPTAILEMAFAHGEIWIKEICYKTELVNVSPNMPSIEREFKKIGIKREEITADSAEPKSIAELKGAGFNVKGAVKGKDSVSQGIDIMKRYPINIIKGSVNVVKELKAYRYVETKDGDLQNKPIDAFNHALDCARYWALRYLPKKRKGGIGITVA